MEIPMHDTKGRRRSLFEIRDPDQGVFVRVMKHRDGYQVRVFDLDAGEEVGAVNRRRFEAALDYARACVA